MEFNVLALPNNGLQYFGFLNTGMRCFAFQKNIVDFVFSFNIGVLYFGFSKQWNSVFLLFKD